MLLKTKTKKHANKFHLFSSQLIKWSKKNHRSFPWRDNREPYRVLVSEIMLQQTKTSVVIEHYNVFLQRFPSMQKLAEASIEDVLGAWSGLGYYRRAKSLKKTTEIIMFQHAGIFPQSFQELKKLPGIGNYTAAAILAFAFNIKHPVIDGNIHRVLSRFTGHAFPWSSNNQEIQYWSNLLIPDFKARIINESIMDLASTICLPRPHDPKCNRCPLNHECHANRFSQTNVLPIPRIKKSTKHIWLFVLILEFQNQFLMAQPQVEKSGLVAGTFIFPSCWMECPNNDPSPPPIEHIKNFITKHTGTQASKALRLSKLKHSITHHTIHVFPTKLLLNSQEFARIQKHMESLNFDFHILKKNQIESQFHSSLTKKILQLTNNKVKHP